jgi:hypothetical protein
VSGTTAAPARRTVLRGWGNYHRTGNAGAKFVQIDLYVHTRLCKLSVARKGRNIRPGQAAAWTPKYFWGLGLHRLGGTIRYPEATA